MWARICTGFWILQPGRRWAECVFGGSPANYRAGHCCRGKIPTWRRRCAMSEHIQPAPEWRPEASREHARPEEHERTPGVSHESEAFNFRLVISVGVGLAVVAVLIHVAVWFLLG